MVLKTQYSHFKYRFYNFFNTYASFQSFINKMLTKKLDIFIIMYLDNILICTKNLS